MTAPRFHCFPSLNRGPFDDAPFCPDAYEDKAREQLHRELLAETADGLYGELDQFTEDDAESAQLKLWCHKLANGEPVERLLDSYFARYCDRNWRSTAEKLADAAAERYADDLNEDRK